MLVDLEGALISNVRDSNRLELAGPFEAREGSLSNTYKPESTAHFNFSGCLETGKSHFGRLTDSRYRYFWAQWPNGFGLREPLL